MFHIAELLTFAARAHTHTHTHTHTHAHTHTRAPSLSQGMAPFIAAMLAAEQAAVSAASRGAAPDFASVSALWPGVSSNTNASHAHAQAHARAGAAPDADFFAELRALSAASVAAGGRDHYHLALRSIVYGAVARFMKYRCVKMCA